MQQLTELDNTFLQMESSRTPMHITPVIFYDQSSAQGGKVRFKDILEVFRANLHKSKIFRRKLAGGAMGFDTPYWVEDPDFDLEFHVRHIALPRPGDWRQLCILMSRLHARGLDMSRPLWEAYVIEGLNEVQGLPPHSFAILLKIHHAAIDGVSGAEIIQAIHSLSVDEARPPFEDDWHGEADPSPVAVWSRAYLNNLKRPMKLFETARELLPNVMQANRESSRRDTGNLPPLQNTPFNAKVSSYRVTDTLVMELDRVKAIRQAVAGATVNDVIVSVVSGALRKYLLAHDSLPERSLTCGAPINVRTERNSQSAGNQVGMMTIDMATTVEDPLQRLRAVMANAGDAKQYSSAVGPAAFLEVSEGLWPQMLNLALHTATLVARTNDIALPLHTVVSNVPGPQVPLYLAGARAHMMMGMGPLLDMAGLFHAVISYCGTITINFTSCRELLPDPDFYKECLEQTYAELENAALGKQPKTRAKPKARRKPRAKAKRKAAAKPA